MKKTIIALFVTSLMAAAFSGCATMELPGLPAKAESRVQPQSPLSHNGTEPFHIFRSSQSAPIPSGATVGIVSGTGSGSLGIMLGAALESRGLTIREMNLYSLLPPGQQILTDPRNRFTFADTLVREIISVVNNTAVSESGDLVRDVDIDSLLSTLMPYDDLMTEKQRVNSYLALAKSIKEMVSSFNVDYILVGGSPYEGLSFGVKIYDTKNLNVVFSNIFITEPVEWNRIIPRPQKTESLSFEFEEDREPLPYWELSYSEYIADKLIVE